MRPQNTCCMKCSKSYKVFSQLQGHKVTDSYKVAIAHNLLDPLYCWQQIPDNQKMS